VCPLRPVFMSPVGRNPLVTTVTVAVPLLELSWVLMATTWNIPIVLGAVYWPLAVMAPPEVPSCTLQTTFVVGPVLASAMKARTPWGPKTSLAGTTDTVNGGGTTGPVLPPALPPPSVLPPPQPVSAMSKASRTRAAIQGFQSASCAFTEIRPMDMRAQWDTRAGTVKRQYAAPVECRVLPCPFQPRKLQFRSHGPR
jgi:hypothetical protein